MKRVSLVLPAFLLGSFQLLGCAGTPEQEAAGGNPYPSNYRQLAAEYVRQHFLDPESVRDAEIAPPKLAVGAGLLGDGSFATPWLVCLKANAKNRMGGYTGRQEIAIQVYRGKAVGAYDEYGSLACSGSKYQPFREVAKKS